MTNVNPNIEALIPHRNSMRLVEEVIRVDESHCVTAATVSPAWPLFSDGHVHPIVLIELAAQTAGVHFGWQEARKTKPAGLVGWLVGVKKAVFLRERIPVDSRIVVSIEDNKSDETYAEIVGTVMLGSERLAEIELQVFRPESGEQSKQGPGI